MRRCENDIAEPPLPPPEQRDEGRADGQRDESCRIGPGSDLTRGILRPLLHAEKLEGERQGHQDAKREEDLADELDSKSSPGSVLKVLEVVLYDDRTEILRSHDENGDSRLDAISNRGQLFSELVEGQWVADEDVLDARATE